MTTEEHAWLRAAAQHGNLTVELGVASGDSLVELARGVRDGCTCGPDEWCGRMVYGVDTWGLPGTYPGRPQVAARYGVEAREECDRRLAAEGLEPWVTLVQGFSVAVAAAWDRPEPDITLLHVDTRRTEESVLCDVEAWRPHLAPDAWIAYSGASARFPGVLAALDRLHGDRWKRVGQSMAVARARW